MTDILSNSFDLIVITIILFSGLCGLIRGITKETLSLIRWLVPLFLAFYGYSMVGEHLRNYLWDNEVFVDLASGSLIFLVFFLIFTWVRDKLSSTAKAGPLSPIDRIFGLIYGFIRGFVLICLVYIVFEIIIPNEEEKYPSLTSSFSYPYVKKGSNFLRNSISFTKETTLPEVEI